MFHMFRRRPVGLSILPAMIIGSTVLLASCAAQVRVAGPAVYVPPPPPAAVIDEGPAVVVRVRVAPPPLPVYEQPACPIVGWIWIPGYWAWGSDGYYWVPGTWVAPPRIGVLWTPGYWGFVGGAYVWHAGYWGPHVGFYGGVNYGFGYTGVGFAGGRWVGSSFAYNRSVTNVTNIHVTNVYNETVINNVNVTRVSYNGGADGTRAVPNAVERMAQREAHLQPTPIQRRHIEEAERNPALSAKANSGRPPIAATARPAAFNAAGVVRARGANPALEDAARRRGERNGQLNARAASRADFANRQGEARLHANSRPLHPNAAHRQHKKPREEREHEKQR